MTNAPYSSDSGARVLDAGPGPAAGPATRLAAACRHCSGSGREPAPLLIEFPRGEQARAAEAMGISESMLSMLVAGERAPSALTLIKLAKYLRVTVDRVLRVPAIWRRVHEGEN